jgi:AP-4 complex subunit beta-1
MKLFFQRPPEVQRMLGRLLQHATDDVSSQDFHDRALLYYRMLKSGADPSSVLAKVIQTNTSIPMSGDFAEDDDAQLRKELLQEFNTLAPVYAKSSANFIKTEFQVVFKKMPEDHPLEDFGGSGANAANVPSAPQGMPAQAAAAAAAAAQGGEQPPPAAYDGYSQPTPPPAAAASQPMVDLLGGFDTPAPELPTSPRPAAASAPSGRVALSPSFTMTGEEYQAKWGAIAEADSIVTTVMLRSVPASTDVVEAALAACNVMTMASGELPAELKFFLYAHDAASGGVFLIQSNIGKQDAEPIMILTVKVAGGAGGNPQPMVDQLMEVVQAALG